MTSNTPENLTWFAKTKLLIRKSGKEPANGFGVSVAAVNGNVSDERQSVRRRPKCAGRNRDRSARDDERLTRPLSRSANHCGHFVRVGAKSVQIVISVS
uniref:MSP domain-containing protein n=1 Tax=Angiostrongylus cantonensis TaxID=6313 RepID=A0A0K0CTG2_ANGCA